MDNCKDVERWNKINSTWDCRSNPQNLKYGDALAENKGTDAYGFIEFVQYYHPDTSLTRRLLLAREGILVIRDDLLPGKSVDGYTAGPLRNLTTFGPSVKGGASIVSLRYKGQTFRMEMGKDRKTWQVVRQ